MAQKAVDSPRCERSDLTPLLQFLNFDFGTVASLAELKELKLIEAGYVRWILTAAAMGEPTLQEAIDCQAELKRDLTSVLTTDSDLIEATDALLHKIDNMPLRSDRYAWSIENLKESMDYTTIEIAGRTLAIVEYEHIQNSLRHGLYRFLDNTIRTKAVSLIRRCLKCEKFFPREGRRTTYCSTACEIAFNNKRRTESGYFAKKMQERRDLAKRKKRSKSPRRQSQLQHFIQAANSARRSGELDRFSKALRRIGNGRASKAWDEIARWETAFKNGASEAAVLKTIKPHIREAIWETDSMRL